MAFCNSRVKIDYLAIKKLSMAAVEALEKTADWLHTQIGRAQVVPMDKGTLSGEAFFPDYSDSSNGTVSLVHSTPYARRLYFHPEYHFSKKEHENAQGKWFKHWIDGKKSDSVSKAYAQFYKQEAGT
ncbi:MAG: hypothetical protein ACI4TK_09810 [Agathobacter sp.]